MTDKSTYIHNGMDDVFQDGGVRQERVIRALIDYIKSCIGEEYFEKEGMLGFIDVNGWSIMETSIQNQYLDMREMGALSRREITSVKTTHRLSCKHGHGSAEVVEKNDVVTEITVKEISKTTIGKFPGRSINPPSIEEMLAEKKQNEAETSKLLAEGYLMPESKDKTYIPKSTSEPTWGTW